MRAPSRSPNKKRWYTALPEEARPRSGRTVGFKGSAVRPRSTPAYTMRQRAARTTAKEPRKSEASEQEAESNKQESPT